jgi:thiol-disulfide isomerase/thioredoxin
MRKTVLLSLTLLVASFALAAPSPSEFAARWSAQLTAARPKVSETYQVPFEFLIEDTPAGLKAALLNGSNRMEFSSAVQHGSDLTLRLDQYDATLTAHCVDGARICTAIEGEYVRQKGSSVTRLAISARRARVDELPTSNEKLPELSPEWKFSFTDAAGKPDSEGDAPARFSQDKAHVEGTIAPVSGDYGTLSGSVSESGELHLSRFDGIHALRLDGRIVSPDRIEGVFHVAPGYPLTFVATRATAASGNGFAEAEHLTSVADPSQPFRFHGTDASGALITQDDPRFRGKVVVLDLFGTWCPNCHDEAPVLQSIYASLHERGLEIVGLSYEYVDDRARNLRLLDVYRRKYSIGFPLLLAGTTDQGQIEATLPQLRNFGAYPTTVFLDRHGKVRLIHAGFSGPATGRLEELRKAFEQTITRLLDEQ